MHDPLVVAFHIRRPWPQRTSRKARHAEKWWRPPYVNIRGREWWFPSLITIWHNEPGGADSNTVCRYKPVQFLGRGGRCGGWRMYWWQLHVHHWTMQIHPLQTARRRYLTRCAWCGGRHTKSDPINTSTGGWDSSDRNPWWRGQSDIVHSDCYSVFDAHRLCLCDNPGLSNGDYGQCAFCGKFRAWRQVPTIPQRYLASLPVGSRIPAEKRDWLKAEWAKVRAEREAESQTKETP